MKLRVFTLCAVNILFYFNLSLAQVMPDSNQVKAWQAFNERSQNKWTLRWDEQTGTPAVIYGPKSVSYALINKPEEIARQFLKEYRAIFKMKSDLSDLSEFKKQESEGVHVFDFQQEYKSIPILGAEYSVAVGPEKEIQMAAGKYFHTVSCNTTPSITSEQAMEVSQKTTEIKTEEIRESDVKLFIVPKDGEFILAYRVGLNQ